MTKRFYPKTLPPKTTLLIKDFKQIKPSFLDNFYLSGGTALSLQLNHRESIDLDFFTQKDFDPKLLQSELEKFGRLTSLELDINTLNTFLKGVQVQFLGYPYPLLKPVINWGGIKLSSLIDIACTKLQAISQRGSKKDFIDFYFILQKYSLEELFRKVDQKYKYSGFNKVHILKSLVYFANAESQPMPKMHQKVNWKKVKKMIIDRVTSFQI